MRIKQVKPQENGILYIVSEDGRTGVFDVRPYLKSEAFKPLKNWREFSQIRNAGYFIEWRCGADLSADTIEARWQRKDDADTHRDRDAPRGAPLPHHHSYGSVSGDSADQAGSIQGNCKPISAK